MWIQFQRRFFCEFRLGNPCAIEMVNRFLAALHDCAEGKGAKLRYTSRMAFFVRRAHLVWLGVVGRCLFIARQVGLRGGGGRARRLPPLACPPVTKCAKIQPIRYSAGATC